MSTEILFGDFMNAAQEQADLRARIRRSFPAGNPTRIDIQVLDTESDIGRKTVILTDFGGGTSITNAAEIYWPFVCEKLGVSFLSILAVEIYPDEDIHNGHGSVVSFDSQKIAQWRPLSAEERAPIIARIPEAGVSPVLFSPGG